MCTIASWKILHAKNPWAQQSVCYSDFIQSQGFEERKKIAIITLGYCSILCVGKFPCCWNLGGRHGLAELILNLDSSQCKRLCNISKGSCNMQNIRKVCQKPTEKKVGNETSCYCMFSGKISFSYIDKLKYATDVQEKWGMVKNEECGSTFKDLFMPFQAWLMYVLECSGVKTRDFDKLSKGKMQKVHDDFLNAFSGRCRS